MDILTETDLRTDPRLFALPPDPAVATPGRRHVAEALRASGLAGEIDAETAAAASALPWPAATVRGGSIAWAHDRIDERVRHFGWPEGLYIPRRADSRDFWFTEAPASNRYALAWPAVGNGVVPDWASADTGELFAYTITPFTDPGRDPRSEAGVGIRYTPGFSLGTVDVEPSVEVLDGMLTAVLEYPSPSAGSVVLTASVVIALWQEIPGGYDLIDYGVTPIARITRDKTYFPTREPLPGSLYRPQGFAKRFLVQGARDYVIGVIGRVEISSTLSDDSGRPLTGLDADHFKVYAHETLRIPSISVETRTVYLA